MVRKSLCIALCLIMIFVISAPAFATTGVTPLNLTASYVKFSATSGGEALTVFPAADSPVVASADITNSGAIEKAAILWLGVYKDNKLVDIKYQRQVIPANTIATFITPAITIPEGADSTNTKIKAYTWDSFTNSKAIAPTANFLDSNWDLKGIYIGEVLLSDFNTSKFDYTYIMKLNHQIHPVTTAKVKDNATKVKIEDDYIVGKSPYTTTITVTTSTGEEKKYTIKMAYPPGNVTNFKTMAQAPNTTLASPTTLPAMKIVQGSYGAPATSVKGAGSGSSEDMINACFIDTTKKSTPYDLANLKNPYVTNDMRYWMYGDRNPTNTIDGHDENNLIWGWSIFTMVAPSAAPSGTPHPASKLFGDDVTKLLGAKSLYQYAGTIANYYTFDIDRPATVYVLMNYWHLNIDKNFITNYQWIKDNFEVNHANATTNKSKGPPLPDNYRLQGNDNKFYAVPWGVVPFSAVYHKKFETPGQVQIPSRGIADDNVTDYTMFVVWEPLDTSAMTEDPPVIDAGPPTSSIASTLFANQGASDTVIKLNGVAQSTRNEDTVQALVLYPGVTREAVEAAILANDQNLVGNKIAYAGAATVDATGTYNLDATLPNSAKSDNYTITASVAATGETIAINGFTFANPQDKLNAIAAMNAAAAIADQTAAVEAMQSAIVDNIPYLDIDMKLYDGATNKTALAKIVLDMFKADKTPIPVILDSILEVNVRLNKACLIQSYNEGNIKDIVEYASYFDPLMLNYTTAYADFTGTKISQKGKDAILKNMSHKNLTTLSDLEKIFIDQVVLQGICNSINAPTDTVFFIESRTAVSKLDLSEFSKLSASDKADVACSFILARPTTFDEVQKAIDKAIDERPQPKPKPSSVGGGGGGGQINYKSIPTQTPMPTITPSPTPDPSAFVDMAGYEWATPAVMHLVLKGAISGYPGNQFKPANNITREEFVKIIVAAYYQVNKDATASFGDVNPSDWFYEYVATAVDKKITKGMGDGKFGIGQNITRQDMAVMLYNTVVDLGAEVDTTLVAFEDQDSISDYARDAVYALGNMGVVKGTGNNEFTPLSTATRAEAAQMIYGILKSLEK